MGEIRAHVKYRKNARPSKDGGLSLHITDVELAERIRNYCKKHDIAVFLFATYAIKTYLEQKEEEDRQDTLDNILEMISQTCSDNERLLIIKRLQNWRQ